MTSLTRRALAFAASACVLLFPSALLAADDPRIARARAAGPVSVYTVLVPEELRRGLSDGFKDKTGIASAVYYAGTAQIFSRLTTERSTGVTTADVVLFADVDVASDAAKKGLFRPYKPAALAPVSKATAHHPENLWSTFATFGATLEHNTRLVPAGQAPKTWTELADPKWKSKVAIADPARSNTGLLMLKIMVAAHGWEWVEKLVRNDPLIFALAPQIDQAIAGGERQVGTTTTMSASEFIKINAPIGVNPEPLFLLSVNSATIAGSPNPAGAELFSEYLMSEEASALLVKHGYFSLRPNAPGPVGFPSLDKLKVGATTIPSTMSRQEYLDKYNAVSQAARK